MIPRARKHRRGREKSWVKVRMESLLYQATIHPAIDVAESRQRLLQHGQTKDAVETIRESIMWST